MLRVFAALVLFTSATSFAGKVTVPADLGIGPVGYWFFGPLTANRGAVPHFGIAFDLAAIIDRDWLEANRGSVPSQYRAMADKVTEVRVGPSIFIPSALYVSPPFDAFGSGGMFGATWTPIGLTLLNLGPKHSAGWIDNPFKLRLDANLLLTYLFVFNTMGYPGLPMTHFLRPGVELRLGTQIQLSWDFLLGIGGGAQLYIPQRVGSFIELGPISEAMWLSAFAYIQLHFRFPYEVSL